MKVVIYGLTITSAWGNGHATTYRSLAKALSRRGHTVRFIEKDVEWYRSNRDVTESSSWSVRLYQDWLSEERGLVQEAEDADAVIVGSYFPDAMAATHALLSANIGPLLFYDIDTPITLAQLRADGHCNYLDASLIPKYAAYLSFTGGPALRELEQDFGARMAVAFFCSVDADIYKPVRINEKYRCDLSYLGTYAGDRQPKLMALLDKPAQQLVKSRFLVAGAMYPAGIGWQPNVVRMTHVAPPDHPAFYSSSRFTLNLTRDDMVAAGWSPSVRLFEASACGSAILSDRWEGIDDFLTPGEEILLPKDASEVVAILNGMTEGERVLLGKRARDRILAQHTSEHRAIQFEAVISECGRPTQKRGTIPQMMSVTAPVPLR